MVAPMAAAHTPDLRLAAMLWPQPAGAKSSMLRSAILVVVGTALLAISAKVNVPLPYVPMTLQTMVVMLISAAYGARLALATVFAYLAEGLIGLPVFAGPVGGPGVLVGPTAGYLAGFAVAAVVTGSLCAHRTAQSATGMVAAMIIGHAIILLLGFAWLVLGMKLGIERAWLAGVLPFLAGSVVKSILGALLIVAISRLAHRRTSPRA